MGYNTVAVLLNDHSREIGEKMPRLLDAMRRFTTRDRDPLHGHFGCGEVISQDHADGTQVVVVHGNTGRRLTSMDAAAPDDLAALSQILRAHGYSVRAPGEARAKGPLRWGYAAKQATTPT